MSNEIPQKKFIENAKIKSVAKALTILNYLGQQQNESVSLKKISKDIGIPKSTASGILETLNQYNFINKKNNGRYELGIHLFELGNKAKKGIISVARPYLQELANEVDETVNLGVLYNKEVLLVDKFQPSFGFQIGAQVGTRLKPHCIALGKVLLAYLPKKKYFNLLDSLNLEKLTENTITDAEELKQELDKVLDKGYAIDSEELMEDMSCVAAPIFNEKGENIAAISISGLSSSLMDENFGNKKRYLMRCAERISRDLGGRFPY